MSRWYRGRPPACPTAARTVFAAVRPTAARRGHPYLLRYRAQTTARPSMPQVHRHCRWPANACPASAGPTSIRPPSRIGSMKPRNISAGLGAIRRAQSSGSTVPGGRRSSEVSRSARPWCPAPGDGDDLRVSPGVGHAPARRCSAGPCSPAHPRRIETERRRRRRSPDAAGPVAAGGDHGARAPRRGLRRCAVPPPAAPLSASDRRRGNIEIAVDARSGRPVPARPGWPDAAARTQVGGAVLPASTCRASAACACLRLGRQDAPRQLAGQRRTARSTLSTSSCTALAARRSASSAARAASWAAIRRDSRSASASAAGRPRALTGPPHVPRHGGEHADRLLDRAGPRPVPRPRWPGRPAEREPVRRNGRDHTAQAAAAGTHEHVRHLSANGLPARARTRVGEHQAAVAAASR